MTGGTHVNNKILSDAMATYDLTGTYLENEKDSHGKYNKTRILILNQKCFNHGNYEWVILLI